MRVLIPVAESKLEPIGGPYGYLYNLKNGLEQVEHKDVSIEFLRSSNIERKVYKNRLLMKLWKYNKIRQILLAPYKKKNKDFSEYDMIHFHTTLDLYLNQNNLRDYSGKVILTSHSPEVFHREFIKRNLRNKKKWLHVYIEKIDEYAFKRADNIIFPCEDAEEPYYHTWKKYPEIKALKKNAYKYILTGIKECEVSKETNEIREIYRIPKDAKVLCYVGRHNEAKGYDLIKNAYIQKLKELGYYILVAGSEEPIKGVNDEHWIEVGWTNDPYSIINAADIFILPNRETYFDLIVLEVLSLGKPILMSKTGGNKFFEIFQSKGILYFEKEDINALCNQIEYFFKNEDAFVSSKNNYEIYKNNFNELIFAENYVHLLKEVYHEE